MKKFLLCVLILFSVPAFAGTIDFANDFRDKSGCFILYNLNQEKTIVKYNPDRCEQRISPDSTFKIALSLMAFDQKLIDPNTVFKWDGRARSLPAWNQDQTPKSWLENSAVWVSQELTPQLGISKIKYYLKQFNYGNQDFDDLTHAWLSSTLKISAEEQLVFLKALAMGKLNVSSEALLLTKSNMHLETLANGWELYGKTGSGFSNTHKGYRDGWFVGFIEKADKSYIFVLNFSDTQNPNTTAFGGPEARKIAESILNRKCIELF